MENTAPRIVDRLIYMLSENVVAKTVLQRYIIKIIRNAARMLIMIIYFL